MKYLVLWTNKLRRKAKTIKRNYCTKVLAAQDWTTLGMGATARSKRECIQRNFRAYTAIQEKYHITSRHAARLRYKNGGVHNFIARFHFVTAYGHVFRNKSERRKRHAN